MKTSKPSTEPAAPIRGFYTPHRRVSFDGRLVNPATGEITYPPTRTKQEFKKQCDINNIIKEFTITRQFTHINAQAAKGMYADLPDEMDYQRSLDIVMEAQQAFASLPAKVRDRFDNDPQAFLAFCSDPKNGDELIELGLRERPPRAAPPAEPASPPATTPTPEKPS